MDYETEDAIAMELLVEVADFYVERGYGNVFISDFRHERLEAVVGFIGRRAHRIIRLFIDDEMELKRRVLDGGRSSAYRDVVSAIRINAQIRHSTGGSEIAIDVTGKTVETIADELIGSIGLQEGCS